MSTQGNAPSASIRAKDDAERVKAWRYMLAQADWRRHQCSMTPPWVQMATMPLIAFGFAGMAWKANRTGGALMLAGLGVMAYEQCRLWSCNREHAKEHGWATKALRCDNPADIIDDDDDDWRR